MKKSIRISIIGALVAVFAAANAIAQNVTTVQLSATVPDVINLGTHTFEVTNGAQVSGSGNSFNGAFPTSNNSMKDFPQLSVYWENASVTSHHSLKLESSNGGLRLQGTGAPQGATTFIPYAADLRWMDDDSSMAALFLEHENSARIVETSRGPISGRLRISAQAYEASNLAAGTYSDTLTATITPTP